MDLPLGDKSGLHARSCQDSTAFPYKGQDIQSNWGRTNLVQCDSDDKKEKLLLWVKCQDCTHFSY